LLKAAGMLCVMMQGML